MAGPTTLTCVGQLAPPTWVTWNTQTFSASSASASTVWLSWNTGTNANSIAITSANTIVFQSWLVTGSQTVVNGWGAWNETAEQKREREAREIQWRCEEAKRVKEAARAKLRARKLLVEHLSDEQRASYEKDGFFYLYTKDKCYRVDQGTHGNVKLVEQKTKKILGSYCIQPGGVPDEDAMLAQKLHIEMNETEFIARANFRRWAA